MNSDSPSAQPCKAEWFASTHWSVVLAAKEGDPATASEALEELCRTYWPPLYAFIRREGYGEAEAKDLTRARRQRFAARHTEGHVLARPLRAAPEANDSARPGRSFRHYGWLRRLPS